MEKIQPEEILALQGGKRVSMALDFIPGAGTRITVNGEAQGRPILGEDFYQALLRVWLGGDPVDRKLNGALLGQ